MGVVAWGGAVTVVTAALGVRRAVVAAANACYDMRAAVQAWRLAAWLVGEVGLQPGGLLALSVRRSTRVRSGYG